MNGYYPEYGISLLCQWWFKVSVALVTDFYFSFSFSLSFSFSFHLRQVLALVTLFLVSFGGSKDLVLVIVLVMVTVSYFRVSFSCSYLYQFSNKNDYILHLTQIYFCIYFINKHTILLCMQTHFVFFVNIYTPLPFRTKLISSF